MDVSPTDSILPIPPHTDSRTRTDHPIGELWPFKTNNTCMPTSDPSGTCTRGFYGRYVILATTKSQIKAGVDFARDRNLRLIIRNTGHDFMYASAKHSLAGK